MKFPCMKVCLLTLVAAGVSAVTAQTMPTEIKMFVGQVKTLPADKITRVAVGNGGKITTKVLDNGELMLLGEAPGDTALMVWSEDKLIVNTIVRVGGADTGYSQRHVAELIGDIPGVQVSTVGTHVIVSGTASKEDMARIATAAKLFPQVTSLVTEAAVSMKKMVYMKVQIIEMKRSLTEKLGIQWDGSTKGPVAGLQGNLGSKFASTSGALAANLLPLPNQGLRAYLGVASALQSTINLAQNNGDAYVLAEPELSARSGGEAKFLAGGQVPLPSTSTTGGSSVEFKDYGIRLNIKPAADDKGNIRANITTEISNIDPSVAVNNIPGFLTRSTESEVNLKSGQTLVMSGLVNVDMTNDVSRLPGLSNLPVLGRLFRSDGFKSGRTDLVILVTPSVVDPNSTINRERIEKGLDIRKRFERQLSKRDIVD